MSIAQGLTQPRGLSVFFLTEMWERYGFYALQGTLILFLTDRFEFSDTLSDAILGTFLAMVYLTPIIGGYLADRLLGFKHAIILGGILLCIGYALLATTYNINLIYLYLSTIAIGTGLLKANVSSLLGSLYQEKDPRRDSGFTLFYVGINLGTILAMCASGYIIRYLGWHWNYGTASLGLLIGTLTFILGSKLFQIKDHKTIPFSALGCFKAYIIVALIIGICTGLLDDEDIAKWMALAAGTVCIFVLSYISIGETRRQKERLVAYFLLGVLQMIFWAIFFQAFFSFNLFIDRAVNHEIWGFNIPTPLFIAIESLGVIGFGPLMGWAWSALARSRFNPSTPVKFSFGLIFLLISMGIILVGIHFQSAVGIVAPLWIALMYLFVSLGELSISPIGLSMVTYLANPKFVGVMMGVWFFTLGLGGKLAGVLATYAAIPSDIKDPLKVTAIYQQAFIKFLILTAIVTACSIVLIPVIKRLMDGPKSEQPAA
ncbi:MAG: MFS transporter [Gammaproteobacteria bacterium]|nr:MFS transporter [Gammaproteobacteria bacterium]